MKANSFNTVKETKSHFLSLSLPVERRMGKVHSVFSTSFNVTVDNQLINFSRAEMSLSAHGCLLKKEIINHLLDRCKAGDLVRVDKGVFTFYTSREVLKIDISSMDEIDLSIPKLLIPIRSISETSSYTVLKSLAYKDKLGLDLNEEMNRSFDVLKKVYSSSDDEIASVIDYLIGRGKGLTPSGDDILVGFTMIRKAFLGTDKFEDLFKSRLNNHFTTDISHAYFNALFSGFISSHFITLIESMEKYNKEVIELTEQIGKYGHTSGYDTLFGFYLGLESLINEGEEY